MEWYELWLLMRLDAIQKLFVGMLVVFGMLGTIGIALSWAAYADADEETGKRFHLFLF